MGARGPVRKKQVDPCSCFGKLKFYGSSFLVASSRGRLICHGIGRVGPGATRKLLPWKKRQEFSVAGTVALRDRHLA